MALSVSRSSLPAEVAVLGPVFFLPNGHSKGLWNPRCLVTIRSFRNQFTVCDGIAHLLTTTFLVANKNVSQRVGWF
jgi:hypothetical protein